MNKLDISIPQDQYNTMIGLLTEYDKWDAGEIKNKDYPQEKRKKARKLRRYLEEKLRMDDHFQPHPMPDSNDTFIRLRFEIKGGKNKAESVLAKIQEFCAGAKIYQLFDSAGLHLGTRSRETRIKHRYIKGSTAKGVPKRTNRTVIDEIDVGVAHFPPPYDEDPALLDETVEEKTIDDDGEVTETNEVTRKRSDTVIFRDTGGRRHEREPRQYD
ncbi:MAG: hypothetical protein AAF542_17905 [Pseudomonadota bacterium]